MALRTNLNRAYREAILQRRGVRLHWTVQIDWNCGTATYTQIADDHDADNSVYAWLVNCDGFSQQMGLTPDGVTISDGDGQLLFSTDFFEHLAREEIGGKPIRIYRAITGGTAYQIQQRGIASGEVQFSGGDVVTVGFVDELATYLSKVVPSYILSESDHPTAPGDSLGRPLISAVGRLADWPLMLISQPAIGVTAQDIRLLDDTILIDSDDSGKFAANGIQGTLKAGIGTDDLDIEVENITGGDWPTIGGVAIIGNLWSGGEIVAWSTATASGSDYEMTITRRYAGSSGTTHALGTPVRVGRIIKMNQPNNVAEYAIYYSRSNDVLLSVRRGVYGSTARQHDYSATAPTTVSVVRGQSYVYLVSDADISRDGDPEGAGLDVARVKRRGEEDMLDVINAQKEITFGDTVTIPDRTMTTFKTVYGPGSMVTTSFQQTLETHIDYANVDDMNFAIGGTYFFPRVDPATWTPADIDPDSAWSDEANANDSDADTYATGTRVNDTIPNAIYKFLSCDEATADLLGRVYLYVIYTPLTDHWGNLPQDALVVRVRTDGDVSMGYIFDTRLAGYQGQRLINTKDVTADYDWNGVDSLNEIFIDVGVGIGSFPGDEIAIHEVGVYGEITGLYGWADPENAIDRETGYEDTFATWTAQSGSGINQADILTLAATVSSSNALGSASVRLNHREVSVVGWDHLRVRLRTGTSTYNCGSWVEVTLSDVRAEEWIQLPLPVSGIAEPSAVYVDVWAQATAPNNCYLFDTELRLTFDTALETSIAAQGVVALELLGARDADGSITGTTGALIEHPTDVIKWALDKYGQFPLTDLDAATWGTAATHYSGKSWELSGGVVDQSGMDELLQRILSNCMGAVVYDETDLRFWHWPATADVLAAQFVKSSQGPSNVYDWAYARKPITELVNDVTIYYQPRFYGSERRGVQAGSVSRQGGRYTRDAFVQQAAFPYPFLRSYTAGTTNTMIAASQARYGARAYARIAEWIGDETSAAALAVVTAEIFGWQRYVIQFTTGNFGDLCRVGDLVEFCHDQLPRNCLRMHYTTKWWIGTYFEEDLWPQDIPAIYGVVIGKERVSDDEIKITILEWGVPYGSD